VCPFCSIRALHIPRWPSLRIYQDYLYNLAESVRELDPEAEAGDPYLFTLEAAVRALDQMGEGQQREGEKAAEKVADKTVDAEVGEEVKVAA
jgi:hypothetical protein